jgi:hypothetical protein
MRKPATNLGHTIQYPALEPKKGPRTEVSTALANLIDVSNSNLGPGNLLS